MKEHKHLGSYGILIEDEKILLIRKKTGPYDGLLDLPGGSLEFGETPGDALKREFLEETGLDIIDYELLDANSVMVKWDFKPNTKIMVHHVGIFYKINKYKNEVRNSIELDNKNDDSLGADFYSINYLKKSEVSSIVLLELEKLGYSLR